MVMPKCGNVVNASARRINALWRTPAPSINDCLFDICDQSEHILLISRVSMCKKLAEARLWAKRQARAEAHNIRMRELERIQKELEENADRQFDMLSTPPCDQSGTSASSQAIPNACATPVRSSSRIMPGSAMLTSSRYLSSRRSSEDSLEDGAACGTSLRELRYEFKDMEEKFRKAMITNAQLDNEKTSQSYQLEILKDRFEELEEEHLQLRREHREKCRECEHLKRTCAKLKEDLTTLCAELNTRNALIAEHGLVIVAGSGGTQRVLVSADNAEFLANKSCRQTSGGTTPLTNGNAEGDGPDYSQHDANTTNGTASLITQHWDSSVMLDCSLDVRLNQLLKERSNLQDEVSHLKLELEEERSECHHKRRHHKSKTNHYNQHSNATTTSTPLPNSASSNGMIVSDDDCSDSDSDIRRETTKQLGDYKFRAQKAEQDVATLQATVARLESQVIRYKTAADISEKSEETLKAEKRKLQREVREAVSRAEELETSNSHLIKRLDKLKNVKSTLLKEL